MTIIPYYFEDFRVGDQFTTPSRTVTETDIVIYAGLSSDFNPLHTDAEFAAKTHFGGRVAHGMLGTTIIIGLWTRLGLVDGTALAFLETNWKYIKPIFIGDTIHAEITIKQVVSSSKPGKGVVTLGLNALKQDGSIVQEGEMLLLIKSRTQPQNG